MKRTTISLPDRLADAIEREARRRRVPVSQVAREALETRYGETSQGRRQLPFAALGRSGTRTTARDIEAILDAEWGVDRKRDSAGGGPRRADRDDDSTDRDDDSTDREDDGTDARSR